MKLINFIKSNFLFAITALIVLAPLVLQSTITSFSLLELIKNPLDYLYRFLSSSGWGYEVPKVRFILFVSFILIVATVIALAFFAFQKKLMFIDLIKNILKKRLTIFCVALSIILIFAIQLLPDIYRETAIWGNYFREQGVIFYLILIWLFYLIYLLIDKEGSRIIAKSIVISGVIQSIIAINQAIYFKFNGMEDLLDKGFYINGSFGQANFFSGFIMISIIFTLKFLINSKFKQKILTFFALIILSASLILSLSYWGIISSLIAASIVIFYEYTYRIKKKNLFVILLYLFAIGSCLGFFLLFKNIGSFEILNGFKLRPEIWNSILLIFSSGAIPLGNFLFGFGFDTLRLVFEEYNYSALTRVDRAHNVFFDVLVQNGIVFFLLFCGLIIYLLKSISKVYSDKISMYFILATLLWIFRSVVSESGVVNILEAFILTAVALKLHFIYRIDSKQV